MVNNMTTVFFINYICCSLMPFIPLPPFPSASASAATTSTTTAGGDGASAGGNGASAGGGGGGDSAGGASAAGSTVAGAALHDSIQLQYSASERSERAQSLFMSIEISDIYGRTSTSTRMPGKSLLRNGLSN